MVSQCAVHVDQAAPELCMELLEKPGHVRVGELVAGSFPRARHDSLLFAVVDTETHLSRRDLKGAFELEAVGTRSVASHGLRMLLGQACLHGQALRLEWAAVLDNFSPHLSTQKDARVGDWG